MSMVLTSSSRSLTLPEYAVGGLVPLMQQTIAKNYSLKGKLTVQKLSVRGGYKITFETLTRAEWDAIVEIWQDQFDNEEFLTLVDAELGEPGNLFYLNIPDEQDLRWNKQAVQGMQIMLEPRDANS